MMNIENFWAAIMKYNKETILIQIVITILLILAFFLAYKLKMGGIIKVALGLLNIYIGIVYFDLYGTETFQKVFALPLYLIVGILFIYEAIKNNHDILHKPDKWQIGLFILYLSYPIVSLLLGNYYPHMVTYIMPCPTVCLSIIVYSCFEKKNKMLLTALALWGLTGVKSLPFQVYEDLILLTCGIYVIILLIKEIRLKNK